MNKEIIDLIIECINRVFEEDEDLFEIGIGENTLNGRLAYYLRDEFENEEIKVDVEYNRHIDDLKEYDIFGHRAYIDIIIHERLSDDNNLVAFECKRDEPNELDNRKINALVGPMFDYQMGITLSYDLRSITVYWMENAEVLNQNINI